MAKSRKILEHCGLWEEPRAPARAAAPPVQAGLELRYKADPDYVPAPHGSVVHFALRTTRLDEVAARVRAAGVRITMEPQDVAIATTNGAGTVPVRLFFCEGPSGEVIEFFQNTVT